MKRLILFILLNSLHFTSYGQHRSNTIEADYENHLSSNSLDLLSICEKGGTLIYRGETFSDALTPSDFVPALVKQDSCVLEEYGGLLPDTTLNADVFVFYQDDYQQEINIEFNANDENTKAFIFNCACDEFNNAGETTCTQICLGEVSDFSNQTNSSPPGFYYLLVIGPVGDTYNIGIFPNGVCAPNVPLIACNTTIFGNLDNTGSVSFDYANEAGDYNSCYDGERYYAGNDVEYKFFIERPSMFNAILTNSNSAMGLFLYSFLCGRDCIDYVGTPDEGGTARLDSIPLSPGVYYIVIDKDSGSSNDFSLELICQPNGDFIDETFGYETMIENCMTNSDSGHEVHINENADNNEGLLNSNTAVAFMVKQPNGNEIPAYSAYWNNPNDFMPFYLEEDDGTNTQQCSYLPGDSLKIRLVSNRNVGVCNLTYDDNTPYPGLFTPGALSVISQLTLRELRYFQVSPSFINAPPSGPNEGIDVRPMLITSSGIPWKTNEFPEVDWLQVTPDSNITETNIELEILENPTQFPRETLLRTTFYTSEINYYRYTYVRQEGQCLLADVDVITDPPLSQVCEGDSLILTAVPVAPRDTAAYFYEWNTGETTRSITIPSVQNGTQYSIKITDKFCGESDTQLFTIGTSSPISSAEDKAMCLGNIPPFLIVDTPNGFTAEWFDQEEGGTLLHSGDVYPVPDSIIIAPGVYSFYVQARNNSNNCISLQSRVEVNLTVYDTLDILAISDNSFCGQDNGQAFALAWGGWPGVDGYSYTWSNGASGNSIENLTPGTYDVTVVDAIGCTVSSSVAVEDIEGPTVNTTDNNIQNATCGQANGSATASITGGTGPFAFFWNNGTIEQIATDLFPGVYTVTVVDANGCTDATSLIVMNEPGPSLQVSTDREICLGESIEIMANGSGGTGDLVYQWSDDLGNNSAITVTPTANQSYTVTVTDQSNCTETEEITIIVNPLPEVNIEGITEICLGETTEISLTAEDINNYSCQWDGLNSNCIQLLQPDDDLSIDVILTNNSTGCSEQATVNIIVNDNPMVSTTSTNSDCGQNNGTATVFPSGGAEGFTQLWSTGENEATIYNLEQGIYYVTITDTIGCTSATSVIINDITGPLLSFPQNTSPLCIGDYYELNLMVLEGVPPYTYEWNEGLPAVQQPSVIVDTTTTYIVTVTDNYGCSSTAELYTPVYTPITIDFQNIPQQLCAEDEILLLPIISGDWSSVMWNINMGGVISNSNATNPVLSIQENSPDQVIISLTCNSPEGACQQVTDSIAISIQSTPEVGTLEASCTPDQSSYTITLETDADSIIVSHGTISITPDNTFFISEIDSGQNVLITLINSFSSCEKLLEVSAPICNCNLAAPGFIENESVCDNMEIPFLEVEVEDNLSVNWYNDSGILLMENTDGTFQADTAGSYFAQLLDPVSACTSDSLTEVILEILPTSEITINGTNEICSGDTINLTAQLDNFDSIVWSTGQEGVTSIVDIPSQNPTIYSAVATLGQCESIATFEVSIYDVDSWDIVLVQEASCNGSHDAVINLQSEEGSLPDSILWNTGDNTTILLDIGAGTYEVTFSDANGCEFIISEVVTEPSEIEVFNITSTPENDGLQNGTITFHLDGGTPNYNINLRLDTPGGLIADTLQNVSPGTAEFTYLNSNFYYLEIIDANGCSEVEDSVTIDIISPIVDAYKTLEWKVYPNPSTGQFYIEIPDAINHIFEIQVKSIAGNNVFFHKIFQGGEMLFQLNLLDIPKGIYLIQLKIEGYTLTKKLVIQ